MLKLTYDNDKQRGDLSRSTGQNLDDDAGLATAVVISLHTDRRVDKSEATDGYRSGCWFDGYANDVWGSRLWLLKRGKVSTATIALAKSYIEEALQWLLNDGVAKRIIVKTSRGTGSLSLRYEVTITKSDDTRWTTTWEGQLNEF